MRDEQLIKSLVTFMRTKILKTSGKTDHSGRGSYRMLCDIDFQEAKKRIESKQDQLRDLLESCEIGDNVVTLIFKKEVLKNPYYREFRCSTSQQYGTCFGVYFTFD